MKNRIAYLVAALLVGSAVYAIMHWIFRFSRMESLMFGVIAATAEIGANYLVKRFFPGRKKNSSA